MIDRTLDKSSYKNWLIPLVWILGFLGYQVFLLAVVAAMPSGGSTLFSMGYRAVLLALSLFLILFPLSQVKLMLPQAFVVALAVFCGFYSLRIIYESSIGNIEFWEYFAKVHGAAFIPMFAFMYPLSGRVLKRCFWGVYITGAIAVFTGMYIYRDYLGSSYRSIQYISGVDKDTLISPHKLSYTGGLLCALSAWFIISLWSKSAWKHRMLVIGVLVPSAVMMLFGGSRGALLAFGATVVMYFLSRKKVEWGRLISLVFIGGLLYLASLAFSGDESSFSMMDRIGNLFTEVSAGGDQAGSGRLGLWGLALGQFFASPIVGSGIVEQVNQIFPHNHVIESFMATGVIGGVAFIVLSFIGLKSSFKLLRANSKSGWVAVIFVFYFTNGLVSNPIYSYEFWMALGAVVSMGNWNRNYVR